LTITFESDPVSVKDTVSGCVIPQASHLTLSILNGA